MKETGFSGWQCHLQSMDKKVAKETTAWKIANHIV